MPKNFTQADVQPHGAIPNCGNINIGDKSELHYCPLWWHVHGLQQTASGYGAKLVTANKIEFEGKKFRVYATCYGNAASNWFTVKGKKIFIN